MEHGLPHIEVDAGTEIGAAGLEASRNALARGLCHDLPVAPTVMIVDDHADFREAASALLAAEGFSVVGHASGGREALAAVERLRPEVVLLDVQLPDLDGFAVSERLSTSPDPPVVVLVSSRDAEAYGGRLATVKARGFLTKRELSGAALAALLERGS